MNLATKPMTGLAGEEGALYPQYPVLPAWPGARKAIRDGDSPVPPVLAGLGGSESKVNDDDRVR